jgi:hypothetical protein
MQDGDDCKVTVHSNAHRLLFDNNVPEIKVKQDARPLVSKDSEFNKRKHRAPQVQKGTKPASGYG